MRNKFIKLFVLYQALFFFFVGGVFAQSGAVTQYFHLDAFNSTIGVTDKDAKIVYTREYFPYGERKDGTQSSESEYKIRYSGKYSDDETGFSDFGARIYSPDLGRFLSQDPVGFSESSTKSFNKYIYANNNPYKYKDPDGKFPILIAIPIVAAALFSTNNAQAPTSINDLSPMMDTKTFEVASVLEAGSVSWAATARALSATSKSASQSVAKGGRGQQVGRMIKTDGSTTASAIKAKAESVGFKPTRTANGPLKMVDENGVARVTIKGGSQRAPGSAGPHVELKTSSGQRVNPAGNSVTRKSPGNHTPIYFDL